MRQGTDIMNQHSPQTALSLPVRSIRIAILAMGGEGGGVLANWLIDMARAHAYTAQMTSVPGVAQRTGATSYYIEMFPVAHIGAGQQPVLAVMPVQHLLFQDQARHWGFVKS